MPYIKTQLLIDGYQLCLIKVYIYHIYNATPQVRTTSPFQWILLTEKDYIVPFNEVQHPFSELFQEDGRHVSINYS